MLLSFFCVLGVSVASILIIRPLNDLKHLFFTKNVNHKEIKMDLTELYCSLDNFFKSFLIKDV